MSSKDRKQTSCYQTSRSCQAGINFKSMNAAMITYALNIACSNDNVKTEEDYLVNGLQTKIR